MISRLIEFPILLLVKTQEKYDAGYESEYGGQQKKIKKLKKVFEMTILAWWCLKNKIVDMKRLSNK